MALHCGTSIRETYLYSLPDEPVHTRSTTPATLNEFFDIVSERQQFLFCPVIRTAPELAEHLKHIDQYDFTAMDAFKEEFLTMCDGHSTERIADYLTENRHN